MPVGLRPDMLEEGPGRSHRSRHPYASDVDRSPHAGRFRLAYRQRSIPDRAAKMRIEPPFVGELEELFRRLPAIQALTPDFTPNVLLQLLHHLSGRAGIFAQNPAHADHGRDGQIRAEHEIM